MPLPFTCQLFVPDGFPLVRMCMFMETTQWGANKRQRHRMIARRRYKRNNERKHCQLTLRMCEGKKVLETGEHCTPELFWHHRHWHHRH